MFKNVEPFLPGAVHFELEEAASTHDQFVEQLRAAGPTVGQELFVGSVSDLEIHPKISYKMDRGPGDDDPKRDWLAPDHMWHIDGTKYSVQPYLTILYARHADTDAPGTDLLCTQRLLEIVRHDGLLDGLDTATIFSVFEESTYYEHALPLFAQTAPRDVEAAISRILAKDKLVSLEEKIAQEKANNPAKVFEFTPAHATTGQECLFIDGGARMLKLGSEVIEQAMLDQLLNALRTDYLGNVALLRDIGCMANSTHHKGQGIAFVQKGTLHRARPGNDARRELSVIGLQPIL